MSTNDEMHALNEEFGLSGAVRFDHGQGGLPRALVAAGSAAAEIYLQGAHVTLWQPADAAHPGLFMSPNSHFAPGKAIRGGVPIVFPWFGDRADGQPGPAHGFVRTLPWRVVATERLPQAIALTFGLEADATASSFGYHDFSLRYRVVVGASLQLSLTVHNTGSQPLPLQDALHTYFAVGDIRQVTVTGLVGTEYFDKADGMQRKRQQAEAIHFTGETDQLHLSTQSAITIHDPAWQRRMVIEKQGSSSTIVWNPWLARATSLTDLGPESFPSMVCVEPANASENSVQVPAGATHTLGATLGIQPLAD